VIEGFVEKIRPSRLRGWTFDRDRPDDILTVRLLIDGRVVAEALASMFRDDLLVGGYGHGKHGFMLDSPTPIPADVLNQTCIAVEASSIGGERKRLPWSNRAIRSLGEAALKVFIVGAPRSGTSVVFHAIKEVLGLPGHGESHLIPGFQRVFFGLRKYVESMQQGSSDILIKEFEPRDFESFVFDYIRNFYESTYDGERWIDKTPSDEAVHGVRLIEAIFPEARLIVTKRTGVEVVDSHMTKFASSFEGACIEWRGAMEGILTARKECAHVLEVDQFDLASRPKETASSIAQHLACEEQAAALGQFFATQRIDQQSSHDWASRCTLDQVSWEPAERELFLNICGPMMQQFGYPLFRED
jgi:hypothetical protein